MLPVNRQIRNSSLLLLLLLVGFGKHLSPTITSDDNTGFRVDVSDLKPGLYFMKIETSHLEPFDYYKVSKIYIK